MRRRLLRSTMGVAVTVVLIVAAGLAISTRPHHWQLTPLPSAAIAISALVIAGGLAMAQARRLARPAENLARAADRIRSGDSRRIGRRYGIGELDRIADGLDSSVQRVTDFISADRDFAVDASHQLRTPLTALSMRLEEMIEAADDPAAVREEGAAALAQTDRLTQVVSQLLGRARRSPSGAPTLASISEIVSQQVLEWEPPYRNAGRRIEVQSVEGADLRAYVSVGGVSQVVATLLENALVHGGGTVTIRTSQTPRSVVIEVKDEGKGVPADLVYRIFERNVSGAGGTGLGLALARSVAASDGGQLVLVRARPATFAVIFPQPVSDRIDEPAVAGPA